MQPLAYLAVRALLAWVQFVQRSERAFVNNPLVLIAGGAVHCWAVVYSLFVAVHTRAMRYDGYHEGYVEHLPRSVAWTETLAMASLWVWLLAGFTTAAVRILDDDSGNLPMGVEDVKGGQITKIIRSPLFHSTLGHAHSISCVGLFLSILMLSVTMTSMKGGITACEFCLVIISVGFALPHALLAARRLSEGAERMLADLLPQEAAEAAAAEAAALGPQLCIILALADAPGHAFFWQNAVYTVTSVAFLVGIGACAKAPPKSTGAALPPEPHESIVCMALDGGAVVAIVLSYPHLNTWLLWLSTVAVFGLAAFAKAPPLREVYEDWLEPVFVVRSDTYKRMPSPQRQFLRRNAWVLCLICTVTALWDIIWHPVVQSAPTPFTDLPGPMMLRWQTSSSGASQELLGAVATTLGLNTTSLEVEKAFPDHRLLLFKYVGEDASQQELVVSVHWRAALLAPKGQLADLVDSTFPASFNISMCSHVAQAVAVEKSAAATDSNPGTKDEATAAYAAACEWWKERFIWQLRESFNRTDKNGTDKNSTDA